MFSYKWNDINGRQCKAEFFGEWKRLCSCRAATLYKKPKTTSDRNWTCEESFLISYGTAIGYIGYYRPNLKCDPQLVIGLNDQFNCSATTIQHVSKWLLATTLFTTIPIGNVYYKILRDAMKQIQNENSLYICLDETVSLIRLSQTELFNLMGKDGYDVIAF